MGLRKEYFCDICKSTEDVGSKQMQVIFTTNTTDGRGCDPYLSIETFDICGVCFEFVLRGDAIFAHGAQGNNTYHFKDSK